MSLLRADARALPLQDGCVQCCVTSPPYFGLRDYGVAGQIVLEQTPETYVAELVAVFREVRRVLREDGVVFLNLGDSYAGSWGNQGRKETRGTQRPINGPMMQRVGAAIHAIDCDMDEDCSCGATVRGIYQQRTHTGSWVNEHPSLKPKDLIGIPWRVAFALQADGWYLRADVIWHKPNPMPESVTDRPTKAHEYVFLLTKAARYYYDAEAIAEPADPSNWRDNPSLRVVPPGQTRQSKMDCRRGEVKPVTRNVRSVWTIATQPYPEAHFATFPEALAERCIKAGSRPGDLVLDPFGGSGTVAQVARRLNRRAVCTELNPAYLALAQRRIREVQVSLLEATA